MVDLSQLKVEITPEWLDKIHAAYGSDDGEILAASPDFLKMGSNQGKSSIRHIPTDGKELLELMASKLR